MNGGVYVYCPKNTTGMKIDDDGANNDNYDGTYFTFLCFSLFSLPQDKVV